MKILVVTNSYPTANRPWEGAPVLLQVEGLRKLGVEVYILHIKRTVEGKKVYIYAYKKIYKEFSEGKYDILHVQFGGIQALIGALVAKKRCIITFHGSDLHGGRPVGIGKKIAYKFGTSCSKLASMFSGANIVVSDNLLSYIHNWTKVTFVLATGVDYDRFYPIDKLKSRKKLGLRDDHQLILFCDNNGDPIKRYDLAEKAMQYLKNEFPKAELFVLNRIPFDQVPTYINASDLLLVTSDKEGSPNIVKEAIACNVPVVSVDVGDVPQMITGVKSCYIINRDPATIYEKMKHVILSAERSNGRELKQNLIDNKIICIALLGIYREVVRKIEREC